MKDKDPIQEHLDNLGNPFKDKEFNLSEKRKKLWKVYGRKELSSHVYQIVLLQDKEFLRLLKEETELEEGTITRELHKKKFYKIIDKLAGEKLR